MVVELHETGRQRFREIRDQVGKAIWESASAFARRDQSPQIVAKHINQAYATLLPRRRFEWLRQWLGFAAGIAAGVGATELYNTLVAVSTQIGPNSDRLVIALIGLLGGILLQYISNR